jgi:uncharacterized membrane protein
VRRHQRDECDAPAPRRVRIDALTALGNAMTVRLRALLETVRNSLFFIPVLCVVSGIGLAVGMLALDRRVQREPIGSVLAFTVDSARELLATVAGATITVAAIVFALTGLSVQLASSQFSPRVVRGFLRDGRQQAAIGFMVGTFTYTLVVLRAVRSPEGDTSVVPALSTALALALAVVAIVAIVGFVSRTAHRLQSSELIRSVAEETVDAVARQLPLRGQGHVPPSGEAKIPSDGGRVVHAGATGWIGQVSADQLLELLPPGGVAVVEAGVGQFVHPGRRLCTLWGLPDDGDWWERRVNRAFAIGVSRTMQQDVGFGIRQIADVALRALSPGVNDPTTARECIVHLGAILYEILRRDLPPTEIAGDDGRRVVLARPITHAEYVAHAFDEIRQSSASVPPVAAALVETLAAVAADVAEAGVPPDRIQPLAAQARLVVAGVEKHGPLPQDAVPVREAAAKLLQMTTVPGHLR